MAAGARLLAALAALSLLVAGCGSSTPARPDSGGGPRETADRRPPLPPAWRRVVNLRAGFSLGIPPGWTARGVRGATMVRSVDRALAVSIAADRSGQGRTLAPRLYARRTLSALRGYGRLRIGRPERVRGAHYPASAVPAQGRYRRTHVRQAMTAIALQRPRRVTFSLLVFRNASVAPGVYDAAVAEMVHTFRGQPPRF
jgi:hypothetical protein